MSDVCGHSVREDGGADGSVRRLEHSSERTSKTVYDAEAGIGEGHASEEAGQRHFGARLHVSSVVESTRQSTRGKRNSLQAERVGERIGAQRNVGLDQLG